MKKFLLIFSGIFAFLLLALALVPILFKDKIFQAADKAIAKALDANVFYNRDKISLSVFSHFPNLTLGLGEFGVEGIHQFAGDTLIFVEKFDIVVDIMSVISGGQMKINSIGLIRPQIHVIVNELGKANYDIAKPADDQPVDASAEEASEFSLSVKSWEIVEGQIRYNDFQGKILATIKNLNHSGSGDMTQDIIDIATKTSIESLSLDMGKVNYLKNKKLDVTLNANLDLPNEKYTLKENVFKLNEFALHVDGFVQKATHQIITDLKFSTPENTFKSVLSLVPGVYSESFKDLKTKGNFAFDGAVKGIYDSTQLPELQFNLQVEKASMQYPSVPTPVSNIEVDLAVNKAAGSLENLKVELKKFSLNMGANPVSAKLTSYGFSQPEVDGVLNAKINLEEALKAFPVEGLALKGLFEAAATFKGKVDMANNKFPTITANVALSQGYAKSASFPEALEEMDFNMNINNPDGKVENTLIAINKFGFSMSGEPFQMSGTVKNPMSAVYDLKAKGIVDIGKMTKIFPIEGMQLEGKLDMDLIAIGNMALVEAGKFDQLKNSGKVILTQFKYESKDQPKPITISTMQASFDPQRMNIDKLEGKLGKSDMNMTGFVSNYMGYIFQNQTVKGSMVYSGNLLDVNEWVAEKPAQTTNSEAVAEVPLTVVQLPGNIDFSFAAKVGKILYSTYQLDNFVGRILLKDGVLRIDQSDFNMLKGSIAMKGAYDPRDVAKPAFNFDFDMKNVSIPEAVAAFSGLEKLAPIAKNMTGDFSSRFNFRGTLGPDMMPILNSMTGLGNIQINNGKVSEISLVKGLNSIAKTNFPSQAAISDLLINAEIKEGRLFFEPFDMKLGGTPLNFSGSQGIDGTIDYLVKTPIPQQAVSAVASTLGSLTGANMGSIQNVKADVKAGGSYSKPTYTIARIYSDKGDLNNLVNNKIDNVKAEAEARLRAEQDKLKKQAEQAANDAKAKAEAAVSKAKNEAEAKARAEADRLKAEIEKKKNDEIKKLKDKVKWP